ncbi:MAG: orotate phosphoribosyltransferase [Flavobacteriales bacterium]|nr:MAG: orotate phosphoribosyltransferase [Flavobacteriales bacterium]
MNLEGRKIIVNKSISELVEMLKKSENYEELMPEGLQKFESREDGFKFSLKGMPEIALKIAEVNEEKAILKSASSNFDFALFSTFKHIESDKTEVQMLFEGKFNPFMKMMVEKPLKNFMDNITDKIEEIYG